MNNSYKALLLSGTPIIDVRSPAEFIQGSLPASINVPLLDDRQRQQVGTCYKKHGQKEAVELGHRLLTPAIREQRLNDWVSFAENNPGCHLMCFRGGLRSQSVQEFLVQSGFHLPVIQGGYKSVRREILDVMQSTVTSLQMLVLAGRTGTGKTRLLHQLPFTIDLEALANHRGSSFGRMLTEQPSTATFENALIVELVAAREKQQQQRGRHQPLVFEDEARLIGRVALPELLKDKLAVSPAVVLEEPVDVRVELARQDYVDELSQLYCEKVTECSVDPVDTELCRQQGLDEFAECHRKSLLKIKKRLGGDRYATALALFDKGFAHHVSTDDTDGYDEFIRYLLKNYYDPMYDYQMTCKSRQVVFRGDAVSIKDWFSTAGLKSAN